MSFIEKPIISLENHLFYYEPPVEVVPDLEKMFFESPEYPLLMDLVPEGWIGVYGLWFKHILVYLGDTRFIKLRKRLNDHFRKISRRQNIAIADMTCKFIAFKSDKIINSSQNFLIKKYKPEWNGSGFGRKNGNNPSKNKTPWDRRYPFKNEVIEKYNTKLVPV